MTHGYARQSGTIQCYKTQYNTVQCDTVQFNAVQYITSHGHAGPRILYSTELRQPSVLTGTGTGMRLIILTTKTRACVVAFYSSAPPLPVLHRCPYTRQARSVYHTLTFPTTPNPTQTKPTQSDLDQQYTVTDWTVPAVAGINKSKFQVQYLALCDTATVQ